jgi:hypothetical protein
MRSEKLTKQDATAPAAVPVSRISLTLHPGYAVYMKGPLVFSSTRWRALRERADPITRDIMELWNRCGLQHDFLGRVLEIEREVYEPREA